LIFCDISKAFDRVWHKGLIHKLKQSGISGNLLKWFQNYLYGREQRVLSTMRYKLVSSAYSLISALISFTISFKKNKIKEVQVWNLEEPLPLPVTS
jgi:hypothetical protein